MFTHTFRMLLDCGERLGRTEAVEVQVRGVRGPRAGAIGERERLPERVLTMPQTGQPEARADRDPSSRTGRRSRRRDHPARDLGAGGRNAGRRVHGVVTATAVVARRGTTREQAEARSSEPGERLAFTRGDCMWARRHDQAKSTVRALPIEAPERAYPRVLGYVGPGCNLAPQETDMGIISFIKGGVAELAIARPDSAKDFWVYKHPDQTIPMKAQLTVDSDEVALFFKDGKFVGSFSAGRHTLDASNIPFLGQLVDKFTGGNVFICEVFFVTTREMPSIKFGTSIGDVQDPQTQLRVRLMVHGEFSAQGDRSDQARDRPRRPARDRQRRLPRLVQEPGPEGDEGRHRRADRQAELADDEGHVGRVHRGDRDLDARQGPSARTSSRYGVEIIRFGDFSISMDQADKDRLDKLVERMAYVNASGGMAGYQQLAQAEMMMGAAEGMKKGGDGGGAFQGAGIGMGFAMAGQMAGMMGNANAQKAPAPGESQATRSWRRSSSSASSRPPASSPTPSSRPRRKSCSRSCSRTAARCPASTTAPTTTTSPAGTSSERHLPYHRMLDDLEVEIVERYGARQGRARGRLRHRADPRPRRASSRGRARGIDLSGGMLAQGSRSAASTVAQASATELPIADRLGRRRVLVQGARPHPRHRRGDARDGARRPARRLGPRRVLQRALAAPARQGAQAADARSPRPRTTSTSTRATTTRRRSSSYLPPELEWVATRGIRVITPVAAVLEIPVLGAAVRWAEHRLADLPGARDLGGFLVACCRKR